MRKALILILSAVLFLLCGCNAAVKELKYDTAHPLGTAEYQMAVNQKLAPLISQLQPLANAESIRQEQAEKAVTSIQNVLDGIAAMNPPEDKILYQADLMEDLNDAILWLKAQRSNTLPCPGREFSDILRDIENAFNVSVN